MYSRERVNYYNIACRTLHKLQKTYRDTIVFETNNKLNLWKFANTELLYFSVKFDGFCEKDKYSYFLKPTIRKQFDIMKN